jgi:anti-sigma regulatory factor (Ser/Thr protein kinase)
MFNGRIPHEFNRGMMDMPGKPPAPMNHVTIPARPDAGAKARRVIAAWLGDHPRLDDALLAVTELVNNAVIHGGLRDGEQITLTIASEAHGIRLTVRHIGASFRVDPLPKPSRDPEASRGLAIVDQIADRWGVDSDGGEVTAWFEVGSLKANLNGG